MTVVCSVTSYLLFLIFRIEEYLHVLLHGIFYPFISANKALRLRSGFTWCSYCLICMFLSNVLLTIVLRFVFFTLAIVLSVCLRIILVITPYISLVAFLIYECLVFLIILEISFWQKTRLRRMNTNDWLINWLVFNAFFSITSALSWRWTHIIYVMNPLHIIVSDCE